MVSNTSPELSSPAMTSTRGIRWGGLTQCIPANRRGCFTALAISVMDMPEVLVASTTSSPMTDVMSFQKACLVSMFSETVSRTKSALVKQSLEVVMIMRPSKAADSSAVKAPCSTSVFWLMEIRYLAFSRDVSDTP